MQLNEAGEARVRGYLFILGRSLRSFLPKDVARDALREVEGHILERAAEVEASPNEAAALEAILTELGPPLKVAQAYAAELAVEEALATGRLQPVLRALVHIAMKTAVGFGAFIALLTGYGVGFALIVVAALKPVFPENVGLISIDGHWRSLGAVFPLPPGGVVHGGYWIIPISLALGLATIVCTHRLAHAFLAWFRAHRAPWKPVLVPTRTE